MTRNDKSLHSYSFIIRRLMTRKNLMHLKRILNFVIISAKYFVEQQVQQQQRQQQ